MSPKLSGTTKTIRGPKFTLNQTLLDNPNYEIVDRIMGRPKQARPLGYGSAGLTYRAKYKGIERAIKFLSPLTGGDKQAELAFSVLKREFQKEIELLIKLTHTNICKIVDFGETTIDGVRYDYYVTEYVEGDRFDSYWKNCSGQAFIEVLLQLVSAIEYLHAHRCFHMDIKEENIFIQAKPEAKPHAILLDLGGAKQVPSPDSQLMRADTRYISTDKATRPDRLERIGKLVTYYEIWQWNADLDLYAFGAMISRALATDGLRGKIAEYLTRSGLMAFEWMIERVLEGSSDDPIEKRYYRSASQFGDDLRRLLPEYTWPIGLPELSLVIGHASIQLSKHRVGLTPELLELVNHPLFQRLRNIPQLEYVSLIYPGATHSRFEHSLTTFHMARMFLSKLLEYPQFRMLAKPEYVRATLLVALLHDIGHYPLSHAFEDFSEDMPAHEATTEGQILPDNRLFDSFVCPHKGDPFHEVIQSTLSGLGINETLDGLLRRFFPHSCELLPKLLCLERGAEVPISTLHGLIDSAIDVDKIAYLTDDSVATGLPFGQGVDLHGLVDTLIPPRGNDWMRAALAIREDGLAAAESIVLSRFWMIARVYWHRTNRAIMAMHKFVIAHLIQKKVFSFQRYFRDTIFVSQPSATKLLMELYDQNLPEKESCDYLEARNPLLGLVGSRRAIYVRLLTISKGAKQSGTEKLLYERVIKEAPIAVLALGEEIRKFLTSQFSGLELAYGDVLVDAPYRPRDRLGSNVLVYLDRSPDIGLDLTGPDSVSPMLRSLQDDFEQNVKKCRVFVHPKVIDKLHELGYLKEVRDKVRAFLENKYRVPYLEA